jgi:hypothetical protein
VQCTPHENICPDGFKPANKTFSTIQCTLCLDGYFCQDNLETICGAGEYSTGSICLPCLAGSYCTDGRSLPCNDTWFSDVGWDRCQPASLAPGGSYITISHILATCQIGYHCVNGLQIRCDFNQYSDEPGLEFCKDFSMCGYGSQFASYAAPGPNCTACSTGYTCSYSDSVDYPCKAVDHEPGLEFCKHFYGSCMEETRITEITEINHLYLEKIGSCVPCSAGYSCPWGQCPSGQYSFEGAFSCQNLPEGMVSINGILSSCNINSTHCEPCPDSGYHCENGINTLCTASSGFYCRLGIKRPYSTICAPGSSLALDPEALEVVAWLQWDWQFVARLERPPSAPSGWYPIHGRCNVCPAGMACLQNVETVCSATTYSFSNASECFPLSDDFVSINGVRHTCDADNLNCQACPEHGYGCKNGINTVCKPSDGFYCNGGIRTLHPFICMPGSKPASDLKPTNTIDDCVACLAGYTCSQNIQEYCDVNLGFSYAGDTECLSCWKYNVPNSGYDCSYGVLKTCNITNNVWHDCKACPENVGCWLGAFTPCVKGDGHYCTAGVRDICPFGEYADDNSRCQLCPDGYSCDLGYKTQCSSGSYSIPVEAKTEYHFISLDHGNPTLVYIPAGRVCIPCSMQCAAFGQTQTHACNSTHDRGCKVCKQCSSDTERMIGECTEVQDRECATCANPQECATDKFCNGNELPKKYNAQSMAPLLSTHLDDGRHIDFSEICRSDFQAPSVYRRDGLEELLVREIKT